VSAASLGEQDLEWWSERSAQRNERSTEPDLAPTRVERAPTVDVDLCEDRTGSLIMGEVGVDGAAPGGRGNPGPDTR